MLAAVMGWVGTIGSISAYVLLSRGRWDATSLRYSAMNGVAGLLAGTASAVYGAWPSAFSNFLWTAIAVQSGVTTLRRRRSQPPVLALVPDHDPEPPASATGVLLAA